jgi:signal transduction histidine kinase
MRPVPRRVTWLGIVVGAAALHLIVHGLLGLGTTGQLAWTDGTVTFVALGTAIACVRTVWRCAEPDLRRAWIAIAFGVVAWLAGVIGWDIRELGLGDVAPAPRWLDAPFFMMAPSFAVALAFYRRRQPSRALQLKQIADLGIVSASMLIAGTLLFAAPLARDGFRPYMIVALGYPCLYLSLVLIALGMLGHRSWGSRRIVFGIIVWAQLAFALVDLMYGASTLESQFQTSGIEDTLWLVGLLSVWWASVEERVLLAEGDKTVHEIESTSWAPIVVAVALIALVGFWIGASDHLHGWSWIVLGVGALAAAAFVGLRIWAAERVESAYRDALADGEATTRALVQERGSATRWRSVGTVAGGTAHEINNLLQAVVGNLELLRRRAARGENVEAYLASIDRALWQARDEVNQLQAMISVDAGARGTVLLLERGDVDGQVSAGLAAAGYATAVLPDIDAVLRATKGVHVRAIVTAPSQRIAMVEAIERRNLRVSVVATTTADPLVDHLGEIVDVDGVIAAIEAARRTSSPAIHRPA